jgi:hypothetical protein
LLGLPNNVESFDSLFASFLVEGMRLSMKVKLQRCTGGELPPSSVLQRFTGGELPPSSVLLRFTGGELPPSSVLLRCTGGELPPSSVLPIRGNMTGEAGATAATAARMFVSSCTKSGFFLLEALVDLTGAAAAAAAAAAATFEVVVPEEAALPLLLRVGRLLDIMPSSVDLLWGLSPRSLQAF